MIYGMKPFLLCATFAIIAAACISVGPSTPVPGSRYTFDVPHCAYAGTGMIDPIVNPGTPSAHSHQFFGTFPTVDDTGWADLRALDSTCSNDPTNKSAYWLPTAYDANGVEIVPADPQFDFRAYYTAKGKQGTVFPWGAYDPDELGLDPDFRMITDDVTFVDGTNQTQVFIGFGDCWNGFLDSADHRSHVVESVMADGVGTCPESHKYPIPRIRAHVNYPVPVDHFAVPLAELHADFLNGWEQMDLAILVDACTNRGRDATPENMDGCTQGVVVPGMDYTP